MQASLQATHTRTRSTRPALSLFGVSGSVMSWRAIPMRSASPARSMSSPRCGGVIRPNAMTGSRLACFSPAFSFRNSAGGAAAGGRRPPGMLHPRVQLPEFGGRHGRGRDLDPVAREGTCVGVEVVCQPAGLQGFRHPQPVVEVVTKGRELIQADANANGKGVFGLLLDRLENLE